jgi:hypothetical protein
MSTFTTVLAILVALEHWYEEVLGLEELTKEKQFLWALPGVYVGVAINLLWLKVMKWKVWKLLGIGFGCILAYALMNKNVYTAITLVKS